MASPLFETITLDNIICRRRYTQAEGWQDFDPATFLTDAHRVALLALFGDRCHARTKARLRDCFADNCRRVKPCGILKRVTLYGEGTAHYCAGQDFPSEIKTCRQILIASY
jgi:hypothetical protein